MRRTGVERMTYASDAGIREALGGALHFLHDSQAADGSFALESVPSRVPLTRADNLFSTAMVLGLLPALLRPETRARASEYLLQRRDAEGHWSWLPDGSLPPDADDTACCLGALAGVDAALDRAEGVRTLRRFRRWWGPFRTWMAGGAWGARDRDDAVVNCNVLWAIERLGGRPTGGERAAVQRLVARTPEAPRYYCSTGSLAWAAARAGIATPALRRPAASELAGRPLECALWSLACADDWPEGAELLLGLQASDGGFAAEPWVRDHSGAWQGGAVSTAFAAAALARRCGAT